MPVALLLAAIALVFVPGLEQPFSTPKLVILALGACGAAALALALRRPGRRSLAAAMAAGWIALTIGSPLHLSAGLLLLALLHLRWDGEKALDGIAWTGAALALVVLLQAAGVDPLHARLTSRLRLFGTLGNPDFVAGWLTAAVCIAYYRKYTTLLFLQAAALALLGSFASAATLALAALIVRERRLLLVAALCLAAALSTRNPLPVAHGRLQLHAAALPHLLDAPLAGDGAIRPDHVHDDWLELALAHGIPASLLLAALASLAIATALRTRQPGVAAALITLAARAFVDFPLARPAELALFVVLIALACKEPACTSSPSPQLSPQQA